ncbi:MAG: DNA translocase FtsK [Anaerolineae bacterium]
MSQNNDLMRYQAREIERTLAAKKLRVRVTGGYMGHRLVVYELVKPPSVNLSAIQRQEEELALALGVQSCRIGRRDGCITVEIPRRNPVTVRLTRLWQELPTREPAAPLVGVDEQDTPLLLPLDSPNVGHALITGTTGSGKTVLARAMIASLALSNSVRDLGLILLDPKRRGYVPFVGLPHLVHDVIYEPDEALGVLAWAVSEMERRDREGVSPSISSGRGTPRLVVFIDELADLMLVAGEDLETRLSRLVQRGREAGIHVVACTQKPTAGVIGSITKANFPARLVGSVVDNIEAYHAAGIRNTGAERLLGKGDFLAIVAGSVVRFQAAYISESEISDLVTRLRGGRPACAKADRPVSGQMDGQAGLGRPDEGTILDFVKRFRERQRSAADAGNEPVNKKPPTEAMIEFALTELEEHGEVSQRAVRRFHQREYGTDCNPRRAQAAIDRALERRNGGTGDVSSN